jgi:class 3 adenylate cyclase
MLKKIDEVKKEKPSLDCLNMRIGIHTGTIIGGIVGTEIVRYDIYGSDVVVANKFEETGKTGEIHIS